MSHLKIEDRLKLDHMLNEGRNFQEIANRLKKARSTIVREVRKHRMASTKPGYNRIPNCCVNRRRCKQKHVSVQSSFMRQTPVR